MASGAGVAFASWIAARSVQAPAAVAQRPSPGFASGASSVLLTVNPAALTSTGARMGISRARAHAIRKICRIESPFEAGLIRTGEVQTKALVRVCGQGQGVEPPQQLVL